MIKPNSDVLVDIPQGNTRCDLHSSYRREKYSALISGANHAPKCWRRACASEECTLHQLSPYIGKLKSSIAHDLIKKYSSPGDLVVDPFAGSGTIPLEAALLARKTFSADISAYAAILCKAKLRPPKTMDLALRRVDRALKLSKQMNVAKAQAAPKWVRDFFHPRTLKEVIAFATICRSLKDSFLLACLLGILHHQRPGFLSYPSSHLVPYLRCNKYPKSKYPKLYAYRELASRIKAKVRRAYRRISKIPSGKHHRFHKTNIQSLSFPKVIDCLISSPPYMNTLDYERDNRLRLWLVGKNINKRMDNATNRAHFFSAITSLAVKAQAHLKRSGYCVLVVGERATRSQAAKLSLIVCEIFSKSAPSLKLVAVLKDKIPDIRRSRKDCRGTKNEHILVFKRSD